MARSLASFVGALALLFLACQASLSIVPDGGDTPGQDAGTGADGGSLSDAASTEARATLGTTGGELTSLDGKARLSVPSDALTGDREISVAAAAAPDASAGTAYDFGPTGLTFTKDAKVCLQVGADVSTKQACLGYFDETASKWKCEDACLKKEGDFYCGETRHFTSFAILLGGGSGASDKCSDSYFDSAGGTLFAPSMLGSVTVPKDALAAPVHIAIAELDPSAERDIASKVFELTPNGSTFPTKLEICLVPNAGASSTTMCLGYLDAARKWTCVDPCLSRKNTALCGKTDHFTSFAILLSGGGATTCM